MPHTAAAESNDRRSSAELARVVLDDREKVLRNRRRGEQLGGPDTALSGPRGDVANHGRDEQRHAFSALVQSPHGALVLRDGRQPLGEIRRDLLLRERIEHDLLAETVQTKLVAQSVERMIASNDLGEPEARQPHEAGFAAPTCEEIDELDCRPIAPVQIFRDQQQRPVLGVAIEEFTHLSEHALGGCADELLLQCFALIRSANPRQLQQPGWSNRAQQRRRVRVFAAQLAKRLEHGMERLARPVLLHALSARAGDFAETRGKVLDERGLADSGLARSPSDHANSAARTLPSAVKAREHSGAADQGARLPRSRRWQRLRREAYLLWLGLYHWLPRRRRLQRHRTRNEPITAPRHRFYETRASRIVAKNRSDVADGALQHRVADEAVTPDLVEQGMLRQ